MTKVLPVETFCDVSSAIFLRDPHVASSSPSKSILCIPAASASLSIDSMSALTRDGSVEGAWSDEGEGRSGLLPSTTRELPVLTFSPSSVPSSSSGVLLLFKRPCASSRQTERDT